jgi:hypothetical protein
MYTLRLDSNHRDAVGVHKSRREVKRVEDTELVAECYKRYAEPRTKCQTGRPQIRQVAGIHGPPVNGAVYLKKKPPLNTTTHP